MPRIRRYHEGQPRPTAFGNLLRTLRENRGLTRKDAAALCGLGDSFWSLIEYGYTRCEDAPDGRRQYRPARPSPQTLLVICSALGVDPTVREELFTLAGLAMPNNGTVRRATVPDSPMGALGHLAQRDLIALSRQVADELLRREIARERPRLTNRGDANLAS